MCPIIRYGVIVIIVEVLSKHMIIRYLDPEDYIKPRTGRILDEGAVVLFQDSLLLLIAAVYWNNMM